MSGDIATLRRRLDQVLELVEREIDHLLAVHSRFFDQIDSGPVSVDWLQEKLDTPEGIDQLESFGSKFSRTQDTVMDKLLPTWLASQGERLGTVIDNLNRAERLGLISETDIWLEMRRLRNELVHEYQPDPEKMAYSLERARDLTSELCKTTEKIKQRTNNTKTN